MGEMKRGPCEGCGGNKEVTLANGAWMCRDCLDEHPRLCHRCEDDEGWNELYDGRSVCVGCVFDICNEALQAAKPLAWTKERPTEPGQYLTDIEGDEYSSELTWISERDVACNVKNWSSKMRFFGPIPDAKEAS